MTPARWRWPARATGVALALMIIVLLGQARTAPDPLSPRLLSDCTGALDTVVVHVVAAALPVTGPPLAAFIRDLPSTVTVVAVAEGEADLSAFRNYLGPVRCRIRDLVVGHPVSPWSRDRWLALDDGGTPLVLTPERERADTSTPGRLGDTRVGADLARLLPGVRHQRSTWIFDGGDAVTDDRHVFIADGLVARNLHHRAHDRETLAARLGERLGRRAVLLNGAPDHHAGMVLAAVGDDTVLVGDPSLARPFLPAAGPLCPAGDDTSAATQAKFDLVAERCRAAGCRVVRIPVAPSADGRGWMTYVNVVMDRRDGVRTVYLPQFGVCPALDVAGAAVWRGLGWRVVEVPCREVFVHGGTLRCLVNVLARKGA